MTHQIIVKDMNERIEELKLLKLKELRASVDIKTPDGFWNFCKYLFPDFFKDDQTERKKLCEILQNCARHSILREEEFGRYKKVMINVFPRFAKSFITSIWCLWCLGFHNSGTIMRNAHTASLAEKFSRDIRNFIENSNDEDEDNFNKVSYKSKVKAIFPDLKLSKDKKSLESWALKTAKDVSYFCAGTGGNITGKGFDIAMILDDPVKDPEKAMSESENDKMLDWYLTTHRSRRDRDSKVQGSEIIIMARWSDLDLCGRLLEAETDWLQFTFPAEDENGNSTCEAIFKTKEMQEMKKTYINTGRVKWWNALYNQNTADVSKKLFRKTELLRYDPYEMNFNDGSGRYIQVGLADVADTGEDFYSLVFAMYDQMTGNLYINDWVWSDEPSEITIGLTAEAILRLKPSCVTIESNNGGRWYSQLVQQALSTVNYYETGFEDMYTSSQKETKILVGSSLVMSKCYFIKEEYIEIGSQYYLALNALCSYEKGRKNLHDDAPDSMTSLAIKYCEGNSVQIF